MKKIAFIVGTLQLGGIEKLTVDLAAGLKQTGEWAPSVICISGKSGPFVQELESIGVEVLACPLTPKMPFRFLRAFARSLRDLRPDIVHTHVNFSLPWQVFGAWWGGVRRVIVTQHNEYQYWATNPAARLRLMLYYRAVRPFISSYTTVSERVRSHLAWLVRRPLSDFKVIYNPVHMDKFEFDPQARRNAREQWGMTDQDFVVGTVARLAEQKGHTYLLDAAALLTDRDPAVRFVVVGSGPLGAELETRVRSQGLDRIVLFTGSTPQIAGWYSGFDVFLLPSLWEGLGIALLEAMAAGRPVIGSDVGGIPEVIGEDGGILVPPRTPDAIVEAILRLKRDPALCTRFSLAAKRQLERRFSHTRIFGQYIALYKKVLD